MTAGRTPSWWPAVQAMPAAQRDELMMRLAGALGPLRLRYTPITPTPKQEAFIRLSGREAFFGGAAGPGKSTALLTAALQYVDVPGYAAILFRRTYPELRMPGGLIEKSHEWLGGSDAIWNQGSSEWTFPNGATLTFGHLQHETSKFNYQSAEFQFIGFDELTTFTRTTYLYLRSRARRLKSYVGGSAPDGVSLDQVPLRIRSASNPGGVGHAWVYTRFIDPQTRRAPYMPAQMSENPYLDVVEYEAMLEELPAAEKARLLFGDWEATEQGTSFTDVRTKLRLVDAPLPRSAPRYRIWDMAATDEDEAGSGDPDWTVGTLMALDTEHRRIRIEDVIRKRLGPGDVEQLIYTTAAADGQRVRVHFEQEPGSSGKLVVNLMKRELLGYSTSSATADANKVLRARPAASALDNGQLEAVKAPWLHDVYEEMGVFPFGAHDDIVDTISSGVALLRPRRRSRVSRPRGQVASGG